MTNETLNSVSAVAAAPVVRCFETEDVEDWLVEEGRRFGYFDRSGMFHYGPTSHEEDGYDNPVIGNLDEGGWN
jgi:hypothetical protein